MFLGENRMISDIFRECSQFLTESKGRPLIKTLSSEGKDRRKVKVRKKKSKSAFDNVFNLVFESFHADLRQRAIFANGLNNQRLFPSHYYIFPIDGYKYIYSDGVKDSSEQYKEAFDRIIDIMELDDAYHTMKSILNYDYRTGNLPDALDSGCELIFYNVPYFYAIRCMSIKNYKLLFKN